MTSDLATWKAVAAGAVMMTLVAADDMRTKARNLCAAAEADYPSPAS